MNASFILFTSYDNKDCDKLQNVVCYLYFLGKVIRSVHIVENNFSQFITMLPTIITPSNQKISGLNAIMTYIEVFTKEISLLKRSKEFFAKNPIHCTNDLTIHKNIET